MTEEILAVTCPPPHICCLNILYHTILILLYRPLLTKRDDEHELYAHAARICAREAATVNVFFQAYGRCFANKNQTYLLSYCVYTAATVEIEQIGESNSATAQLAVKRLATTLAMLEDEVKQTPGIRRSVDIIKTRLGRLSPRMRETLLTAAQTQVETSNNLVPSSTELQYQIVSSPARLNQQAAYERGPGHLFASDLPWLVSDPSAQSQDLFTPDVGGGFVPDILSWYNPFD